MITSKTIKNLDMLISLAGLKEDLFAYNKLTDIKADVLDEPKSKANE